MNTLEKVHYDEKLERVAAIVHAQWMGWAINLLKTETITADRRERWASLMVRYKDLPEEEKEKDRIYARDVLWAADIERRR